MATVKHRASRVYWLSGWVCSQNMSINVATFTAWLFHSHNYNTIVDWWQTDWLMWRRWNPFNSQNKADLDISRKPIGFDREKCLCQHPLPINWYNQKCRLLSGMVEMIKLPTGQSSLRPSFWCVHVVVVHAGIILPIIFI